MPSGVSALCFCALIAGEHRLAAHLLHHAEARSLKLRDEAAIHGHRAVEGGVVERVLEGSVLGKVAGEPGDVLADVEEAPCSPQPLSDDEQTRGPIVSRGGDDGAELISSEIERR